MKNIFFTLLIVSIFTLNSSASTKTPALEMNDFSILMPLPNNEVEFNEMLSPASKFINSLSKGELLPKVFWDNYIPVINQTEHKNKTWPKLRVVAVRIDPCFPEGNKCLKQVRMIWQPLTKNNFGFISDDAALHTFYSLNAEEFDNLITDLIKLKQTTAPTNQSLPLQIHPKINQERYLGQYYQQFKSILLKYSGEKNLTRITFMKTQNMGHAWEFEGFDIVDIETVNSIQIPRVNTSIQLFDIGPMSNEDFESATVSPDIVGEDNITSLIKDSRFLNQKNLSELSLLAQSIAKIENPNFHNPNTMDCLSCHTAQVGGSILHDRFQNLKDLPEVKQFQFNSKLPLANTGGMQKKARVLRAFGYFNKTPIISRRVINETAAIAERFN